MNQKTYSIVSAALFLIVAVLHLTRVVNEWEASIDGWVVPLWVSWAGIVIAGFLAYSGFNLSKGNSAISSN